MTNKITPELFDFGVMTTEEKHEYERRNSSIFRKDQKATYNQCRKYACESIANGMTKISVKYGEIIEIPYGVPYNFIGRVSTSSGYDKNTPKEVYEDFETRDYDQDLLFDWFELKRVSEIMKSLYGFSVTSLYYSD